MVCPSGLLPPSRPCLESLPGTGRLVAKESVAAGCPGRPIRPAVIYRFLSYARSSRYRRGATQVVAVSSLCSAGPPIGAATIATADPMMAEDRIQQPHHGFDLRQRRPVQLIIGGVAAPSRAYHPTLPQHLTGTRHAVGYLQVNPG